MVLLFERHAVPVKPDGIVLYVHGKQHQIIQFQCERMKLTAIRHTQPKTTIKVKGILR